MTILQCAKDISAIHLHAGLSNSSCDGGLLNPVPSFWVLLIHLGLCFGNLSVLPAKEGKEAELGCEIHSQSPRGNALPAKVKRREEEWEDEQSAHAHLFLPIE